MFKCDKCGLCCSHLLGSELYKELDRGDGVCKYLEGNLCSIYDRRPLLCRVDECYKRFFSSEMTREEYYKKNYEGCLKLKQLLWKQGGLNVS